MNIINTKLNVGIDKPTNILHISDTHLTLADMRDGERKVSLAERRKNIFPDAQAVLALTLRTSKERQVPIVHTGDLLDFVSLPNLEAAKEFISESDCFFVAGNHEFSLYLGEAKEDAAYRAQSLDEVQKAFKNDIRMSSRVIGGVNFVALDNGYYLFEQEQLDFLKAEVGKGQPIVLLMHNPLYEEELYEKMMSSAPCAYLVDVPEEKMQGYPTDRFEQQLADEITHRTVEYIKSEPSVKAIIAGHLHFNYEGMFDGRIPQLITSCTDLRHIQII